MSKYTQQGIS